MITLKVSLTVNQALEMKAKVKMESTGFENTLPFEDLVIEALPSNENSDIQLRITNSEKSGTRNSGVESIAEAGCLKTPWWRRLLPFHRNPSPSPHDE